MMGGLVLGALALGGGGTFAAMKLLAPHGKSAGATAAAPAPPPKPIFFADLSNIVVSIPPQAGQPATSYVEFDMQFSTYDSAALTSFATYQPIIKADIINLLMNETGDQLQDPKIRTGLIQNCLNISNDVLKQNGVTAQSPAFAAAYITNLVIQD